MRLFLTMVGAAVLAMSMSLPVRAVSVVNTTVSDVTFNSGGFEGEALGLGPSNALTGTWVHYYTDAVITGGVPGAAEGTKYAYTTRDAINAGGPEAHFASNQNFPGDAVHAEWMMYLNPGADDSFIMHGGSTYYRAVGRLNIGLFGNLAPSGSYVYTAMPIAAGVWQKWTIDYAIGSPTYTVSVGGSSVTVPAYSGGAGGGGDWDGLYFGHNGLDTFYLDSVPVPEPASLLMLIAGAGFATPPAAFGVGLSQVFQ